MNLSFVLLITFISFLNRSVVKADSQECNKCEKQTLQNLRNEVAYKSNNCKANDSPYFDHRVDVMPRECLSRFYQYDCATATECTKRSGIYQLNVAEIKEPFLALCDAETENGNWLAIQKRQDGSVNFYRDWSEYEAGFGDIEGEFFIGLEKLHILTNNYGPQELLIVMEDDNSTVAYAKYDSFAIGNSAESYILKRIGRYTGTAGNSLGNHVGMKFTTKDRDNDLRPNENCAILYTGAWWYNNCHHSNPNGKYGDNDSGKGINWFTFRGHTTSLPYIKMMIRRSRAL